MGKTAAQTQVCLTHAQATTSSRSSCNMPSTRTSEPPQKTLDKPQHTPFVTEVASKERRPRPVAPCPVVKDMTPALAAIDSISKRQRTMAWLEAVSVVSSVAWSTAGAEVDTPTCASDVRNNIEMLGDQLSIAMRSPRASVRRRAKVRRPQPRSESGSSNDCGRARFTQMGLRRCTTEAVVVTGPLTRMSSMYAAFEGYDGSSEAGDEDDGRNESQ